MEKKQKGGYRKGAGRKPLPPHLAKKMKWYAVPVRYEAQADKEIRKIVNYYIERCKKEH